MVSGMKKDITNEYKANGANPDKKCTCILSVNNPIYGIIDPHRFPMIPQNPVAKPLTVEGNSSLVYGNTCPVR